MDPRHSTVPGRRSALAGGDGSGVRFAQGLEAAAVRAVEQAEGPLEVPRATQGLAGNERELHGGGLRLRALLGAGAGVGLGACHVNGA